MIKLIRQSVLPHFGIEADEAKISALGNGHINDTLLVRWPTGELVLQRINTQVFKTPQALVSNADKISHHLCAKALQQQYGLQVVSPCLTQEGELAIDLGEQGFWRAISYLPHSLSIEVVKSEAEAEMAAKAFGHFACALSDFDATELEDVIPQFHHLPGRMEMLRQAVQQDKAKRLESCRQWVDYALSQQSLLDELAEISPQLPLRICHNDTKINNMLFDKRDMSSMAIIDLDTCMKGHLMYDFGDMVRTFCSPEAEDSTALDNVKVRQSIFAAICRGYLSELGEVLTEVEKRSLWLGARVICLMIGVRFLTDYLNGDVYFHVHREGHNLDRAANQFTLYQSLLDQEAELKACF
ncbi:aminoglycoside phosphotransferase family protein [Shewanella decolorationis]|uniref:Aminoglycoside phosphotransferase n=1 Tax=Shewanella decolorationis S12 TaxID=1353536 RepID=A0ABP2YZX9_9GAMM|nr:aminoglycoside phosphotransferase family protein [Shewanella decolorationis]ESE39938.1 aminoglycoside phosphotransferase [Shewanella decolorationis S12]GLR32533.1 aminoglycoside phosphotransferase [Shewanella decolorationis]